MYKPRILLYGMGDWSHGRVYSDIVNEFSDQFNVDYINWWQHGSDLPWADFGRIYDAILIDMNTVLEHLYGMFADEHLQSKILPVIHGPQQTADYTFSVKGADNRLSQYFEDKNMLFEDMNRFKLHSCVSPNTVHAAAAVVPGIIPKLRLTTLGVSAHNFPQSTFVRHSLKTAGYFTHIDSSFGQGMNTKRGHLAQNACELAGVPLLVKNDTTFRVMDLWYKQVDVYLMTSIYEGAATPLLEAGICGIPIIAAPGGLAPQLLQNGGGVLTETFNEDEYVKTAVNVLNYWKDNPAALMAASVKIREQTLQHYTWPVVKKEWYAALQEFLDL